MVVTVERIKGRDLLLVLGGVLLMADALGLDLAVPLDLAIGVPYALVVLLGLWWPGRGYIYTAAITGSGLCLLGFYLSFTGEEWVTAVVNRSFALFTIWMVAALCLFQKQAQSKKLELQQLIYHIGQIYSGEMTPREEYYLFKNILDSLLSFTQSRFGVIGEVLENEEGRLFFQERAGVAWNFFLEEPTGLVRGEPPHPSDLENYNMEPLFDEVIKSGKPLLIKYVSPAVSKAPLPAGHRPMESFMGLPFYHEGRLLGVVGVANRVGGYDSAWVDYLKPFLAACAGNIHLLRMGKEKLATENALRENSLKLQDMEKDAGLLQSTIEEKNARLAEVQEEMHRMEETLKEKEDRIVALVDGKDQEEEELIRLEESLSRVQEELNVKEETLRDKEAQVARAEGDRNRTAQALWEKEERLMDVMSDFNKLEKDLREKKEKIAQIEEELKKTRDQLRERDHQIDEIEPRLKKTQDELKENKRFAAQVEDEMFQVERELRLAKKTLREREGLLERIGREIQETLAKKERGLPPIEAEPMQMKPPRQAFQKKEDRQPEEPEKKDDTSAHINDLISHEAGQGICGLDLQGNTTFINHEGAKMLGYASKELIGKNQHTTIHHSRIDGRPYPPDHCHICHTLTEGVVSHVVDEVFWRKDGSFFPVEYLSTPIWKNKGQVGAVVTFTDISRRNDNEKSRQAFRIDYGQKAQERTEEQEKNKGRLNNEFNGGEKVTRRFGHHAGEIEPSNRDLREFAAIAAHDLKEPLRKIIGFGSRLKKDCAASLDDRGRDYLDRMDRAAHQMQKFIIDLLQYSKAAARPTAYRRVDLKDVITDVLLVLEGRIEETHAVIEVGALPAIEADRMQMHQLFQNLISNALKFHKEGEPPVINVSHRSLANGWHEIRVKDQGIGFDKRHLERIFKPFERLHGKMEYEGTGMGLAICQKIVHRHGGEITATSSPRKGTTFIITLPARQALGRDLPQ